jgi:DNA polymerase-3 subunit alpha
MNRMSVPFVHLRLHSEFSVVDGLVRLDAAAAAAAADGQGALALTDSANLFGAVRFYKAARAQGLKPIIGVDAWISNDTDRDAPFRLLLLAMNHGGYLNLCELLSRAWIDNAHRGRAEMRVEWFERFGDGLIALSGAAQGEIGAQLVLGNEAAARAAAVQLAALFPQRFYIELQRAGRAGEETLLRASARLAVELDLPVVATHAVQFIARDDFRAHEARVCIAEGYTLADPRRPRRFTEAQYFKTRAEMAELFADVPAALANTIEIARRCNLELTLDQPRLPEFPTPPGVGIEDYCRDLAQQGLAARLEMLYPDAAEREAQRSRYQARLDLELATIGKTGFAGYFLIVADFITWAKRNGVPVGPGRGSGAGSLVAFSLGVTDLDPLRYDLLFERFLNPERVTMPDFDIDFCQDNRDRVIDYVKGKYGAQAVSQIATFGTLGAKAVVRDAGRVLDLPYSKCDTLSKLIPHNPADPWTLERALAEEPAFAEAVANDEEYAELVALSRPLEGLTRNVGMHAGGVLIAPGKLTDFCPLYSAGGEAAVISQFDKDDVEAIGLVKFDFLGLTTLTILSLTLDYVRRLDPSFALTLETLPLDDPQTFDIFKQGATAAIFQFESRGMREQLKRARPDRFEDLIALNALYRPGPMEQIPDFIDRKHGRRKVEYLHPSIEPILAETYGIMVYQEQVMRIAQVVAGYSLGAADKLRRAMGKKKADEMAEQRSVFVDGARARGVSEDTAVQLFDLMEKFAGYGFNKSHSAAYALLAYQTAYFKAHFPSAFMAANLSAVMDETDKVKELVEDSQAIGLTILGPDVNHGSYRFEPVDAKTIRYGLGALKGTGRSAIEHLVAARASGGPFADLFDFCARLDKQFVNRRAVEALVRAGAFDALDVDRAKLAASVSRALEAAEHAAAHAGQVSLFGGVAEETRSTAEYAACKPWNERERLANEKLALGFYFSGHLFMEFASEARKLAPTRLADLRGTQGARAEPVRLAGIIVSARTQNSRRGRMGVIVLDDGTAQLELTVYAELYDRKRALLREDTLVFVLGRARYDEFRERLTVNADDLMDLAEARARAAARLRIEVDGKPDLARFRNALVPFRVGNGGSGNGSNGCRVVIHYCNGGGSADLLLSEDWRVRADETLIDELKMQPKVRAAEFRYG